MHPNRPTLAAALALAVLALAAGCSTENTPVAERAAVVEARLWLSRIDADSLSAAYAEAGPELREQRTESRWSSDVADARAQLGQIVERRTDTRRFEDDPVGYAPGSYVVIGFRSDYTERADVEELVVMKLVGAEWQPVRYIIDPAP